MKKLFKPIGIIFIVFFLFVGCSKKSDTQPAPLPVVNLSAIVEVARSMNTYWWNITLNTDKQLYNVCDVYVSWTSDSKIHTDTVRMPAGKLSYLWEDVKTPINYLSVPSNIRILGVKDYYGGYTFKY